MELKNTSRNVLIRIALDNKEKYNLTDDVQISLSRGWNFNLREDLSPFATIISGEGLPEGADCLVNHNSSHESFRVQELPDKDIFSIPIEFLFCYREKGKDWQPAKGFLITKRVYKPYKGFMVGIEPEVLLRRLYVVDGEMEGVEIKGKVAISNINNDYEIEFFENGKPTSIIRSMVRDIIGIDYIATEKVLSGEYLIGNNLNEIK